MFAFVLLPLDSPLALYAFLFLILLFSGIGLPIPEEVTLLFGGYLAYLEFTNYWITVYILIVGILAADVFGYFVGRLTGTWLSQKIFRAKIFTAILEKAEALFRKHGEKVVIFSRPLMGVRVAIPMMAGHFKMNFVKFILYDLIAAIPWTFFLVTLSYYLGSGSDLITEVKEIKHVLFIALWVVLVIYAVHFMRKQNPRV